MANAGLGASLHFQERHAEAEPYLIAAHDIFSKVFGARSSGECVMAQRMVAVP